MLATISCCLLRSYLMVGDLEAQTQAFKYVPSDAGPAEAFGHALDVEGLYTVVGARNAVVKGVDMGAAYVFNSVTGQELYKVVPADGASNDKFGFSVAIDSSSAYLYDLLGCTSLYCNVGGGSPNNVTGIRASGCDLLNPITLDLSSGPPGQFTYLLIGSGASIVSDPAGALGDLCVTGGLLSRYRLDSGAISAAGTFSTDISDSSSGGPGFGIPSSGGASIQSGETWNFQYWHRNPSGAPSGFSEAVSVTFK